MSDFHTFLHCQDMSLYLLKCKFEQITFPVSKGVFMYLVQQGALKQHHRYIPRNPLLEALRPIYANLFSFILIIVQCLLCVLCWWTFFVPNEHMFISEASTFCGFAEIRAWLYWAAKMWPNVQGSQLKTKKVCKHCLVSSAVLTSPFRTSSQRTPPQTATPWSASTRSSPAGRRVQLHENVFSDGWRTQKPQSCGALPHQA